SGRVILRLIMEILQSPQSLFLILIVIGRRPRGGGALAQVELLQPALSQCQLDVYRLPRAFPDNPLDLYQFFISLRPSDSGFDRILIGSDQIEDNQVIARMRRLIRIGNDVIPFAQLIHNGPPGLRFLHPHICRDGYPLDLRVMTDDGELIVGCAETGGQARAVRQTTLHQQCEGDVNRQIIFLDDASALLLLILDRLSIGKRIAPWRSKKGKKATERTEGAEIDKEKGRQGDKGRRRKISYPLAFFSPLLLAPLSPALYPSVFSVTSVAIHPHENRCKRAFKQDECSIPRTLNTKSLSSALAAPLPRSASSRSAP